MNKMRNEDKNFGKASKDSDLISINKVILFFIVPPSINIT